MEHQGTPAQQPEYERGMIQVNQNGKTPDRMKRDEWSEGAVETLLDAYESKWVLRNRAKLKGNDWEEVARHVCARSGGSKPLKTQSQCKNKIEALKKRYRSEATSIGGSTSTWGFFTRMDVLLRCPTTRYAPRTGELGTMGATQQHQETMLPQVESGESERVVKMVNRQQITPEFARRVPQLPNGLNASQHFHHLNRQHQHHHHHSHHQPEQNQHHPCQQQQQQELQESSQEEEDASNTLPQAQPMKRKEEQLSPDSVTSTPRSKIAHAMEGSGKTNAAGVGAAAAVAAAAAAAKRRKVSSSSSEVAESIRSFADSILKLEHAKMEMFRDSERLRADAEARRVEMELKRTEIIAKTQLEIAKLLSRKPIKRKVPHKQSTSALNASITNGNTSTKPPSLNGAPAAGGRSMMDG